MKMLGRLGCIALLSFALVSVVFARSARAESPECAGDAECCIKDRSKVTVPLPEHVRVGVRVLRISAISERDATFSADLYILRRWPAGGLRPGLVMRNVVDTANIVEERVDKVDGVCYHAMRVQDDFDTPFLLRRFPFDSQRLRLVLEDPDWEPELFTYDDELWPLSISEAAYRDLQAWSLESYPLVKQKAEVFAYHPKDTPARVLTVELPVKRQWQFFVSRYFFPLLLIVALSYSLFFIKADDLASSSGIGVTAVLAIIAFQITQADSLPKVGYLTMADKVYTVCYVFTGGALGMVIHGAWLSTHGKEALYERLYRIYRRWFPVLFLSLFASAVVSGWVAGRGETDVPPMLQPPEPPAGEVRY